MNEFIEWTEKELVEVEVIDNQHLELVNLINNLHPQLGKLSLKEKNEYANQLVELLRGHFDTEENLMKCSHFPGYISHKLEHDRFYNKVLKISGLTKSGEPSITLDLLTTLKTWLINHLEINDRKCANYFIENGCE